MPNTRSALKRVRQTTKRNLQNRTIKTEVKTAIKKAVTLLEEAKDKDLARDAWKAAVKALSKAASKGAIPKTRASRKIGRLTKFANKVFDGAAQ